MRLQSTMRPSSFLRMTSSHMRVALPLPSRNGCATFISMYFSKISSNVDCGIFSTVSSAAGRHMTGAKRKLPLETLTERKAAALLPFQHRRIRSYIGDFGERFGIMEAGRVRSFQKETPMADEKNIDVQATSDELNDESLNETIGGMEIHNHYVMWSIKCLDWECGAVDAPILPIGQMPERECFKCGGKNVDVNPHYL